MWSMTSSSLRCLSVLVIPVALMAVDPLTGAAATAAGEPTPFVDNYTTRAGDFVNTTGYDGKNVVVFVLDTGVDLDVDGLRVCPDGRPKILDARDMTREGDIELRKAKFTRGEAGERRVSAGEWDVMAVIDTTRVTLPADSLCYFGYLQEKRVTRGGSVPKDLNDTRTDESFALLVYPDSTGKEWGVLFDADADGHLEDETFTRSFHLDRRPIRLAVRDTLQTPRYQQLAPTVSRGKLSMHWTVGGHGTHVAGTIAAHRMYGRDDLNGNAPGAQIISLKIGSAVTGGASTNDDSVLDALKFVAKWSREHPGYGCILSMSYGGTPIYELRDIKVERMEEVLAENQRLIFVGSAGNDGPGLDSEGSPAISREIIAVGNLVTPRIVNYLWEGEIDREMPIWGTSRGGVMDFPACMAPGFHVSTIPPYEDSEAWTGTSMACPQVSGVIACWLSGLLAEGREWFREDIFHTIRSSSRDVGYPWFTQGAGVIDAVKGWETLRKLTTPDRRTVSFDVRTRSPFGDGKGEGPTAYWRGGTYPRGSRREQQVWRLTPTVRDSISAQEKAGVYREYTLAADRSWIDVQNDRFYIRAEHERTVEVMFDDEELEKLGPGVHHGTVRGVSDDGVNEFNLRVAIVIPHTLDRTYRLERKDVTLAGGTFDRHFIFVPPGTVRITARVEPVDRDIESQMTVTTYDPTGREVASRAGYTDNETMRSVEVITEGPDLLRPGIFEVDLYGKFSRRKSRGNLTIQLSGVTLEAAAMSFAGKDATPTVTTTLSNGLADFRGDVAVTLAGYQSLELDTLEVKEDTELPLTIPDGVSRITVQWSIPDSLLDRATNSWAIVVDEDGISVGGRRRGDRFEEISTRVEPGKKYRLRVEFTPTDAVPEYRAAWRVRYEYASPVAAKADPAPAYLTVGRPYETRWTLASIPTLIPAAHEYVVKVSGDGEGSDFEIWRGVGALAARAAEKPPSRDDADE